MLFIWIELFARVTPRGLSIALLIYTLINLAGAYLLGKSAWFRYGEFFGVCLRLIGKMSPWARPWDPQERAAHPGRRRWRMPFVGLLETRAEHMSLVVFVLFMLSSTAFDGLHGTQAWVALFWKGALSRDRTVLHHGRRAAVRVLDEALLLVAVAVARDLAAGLPGRLRRLRRRREVGCALHPPGARARAAVGLRDGADRVRLPRHSLLHHAAGAGRTDRSPDLRPVRKRMEPARAPRGCRSIRSSSMST